MPKYKIGGGTLITIKLPGIETRDKAKTTAIQVLGRMQKNDVFKETEIAYLMERKRFIYRKIALFVCDGKKVLSEEN